MSYEEYDENCELGHWGCTKPEHYNTNTKMKIQITFYEDTDMLVPICSDTASDVLDAEGKLAILARYAQKKVMEKAEITSDAPF